MTERKTTLADGSPVTEDHREIDPETGLQKAYVVLSEEEREKGYVRPLRFSYRHVGPPASKNRFRDLTEEEKERYAPYHYVKYEIYPESESPVVGRFWTQAMLDAASRACGEVTTMTASIAETYATDPKFYTSTFCATCGKHFPVGALGEFVWNGTDDRVGE